MINYTFTGKENAISAEHLKNGEICKVNGHYYLHKISAVKGKTYQISNNHGQVNGTITRNSIYGKVVEIL